MKIKSRNIHLWIDMGLFAGFLLAFWLDLTRLELHQWLGVALAVLSVYHLLLHQKWVEAVSERFFGHTSRQARHFYLLDTLLMAGFTLISATGLLISSWLNLPLEETSILREMHVWSAIATAGLVVLKLGLHSSWIVQALRRSFASLQPAPVPAGAQPAASGDRRAFLKLMGVVAAATLIAVSRAVPGEENALAGTKGRVGEAASLQSSLSSASTGSAFPSACVVQCNRRCTYPGRCRRYTDSNGNGRCDLGECT